MSSKNYLDKNGLTYFWGKVQNEISPKANTSDVLTKTNTTSYTPSANYHPATKKYVDDRGFADLSDVFVITCSMDSNDNPVIDKTWSEIITAYGSGKILYATYENDCMFFPCVGYKLIQDGIINFEFAQGNAKITIWDISYNQDGGVWEYEFVSDVVYIPVFYSNDTYIIEVTANEIYSMMQSSRSVVLVQGDNFYYPVGYYNIDFMRVYFLSFNGSIFRKCTVTTTGNTTTVTFSSQLNQSDWNQSDNSNPDYIKNRPIFIEETVNDSITLNYNFNTYDSSTLKTETVTFAKSSLTGYQRFKFTDLYTSIRARVQTGATGVELTLGKQNDGTYRDTSVGLEMEFVFDFKTDGIDLYLTGNGIRNESNRSGTIILTSTNRRIDYTVDANKPIYGEMYSDFFRSVADIYVPYNITPTNNQVLSYDESNYSWQYSNVDDLVVIPQPDWNENTSTNPSYVANRTHYKTSGGYVFSFDEKLFSKISFYSASAEYDTNTDINKAYANIGGESFKMLVNDFDNYFPTNSLNDIDSSVESITITIDNTDMVLSKLYVSDNSYFGIGTPTLYYYNNDFCLAFYEYNGDLGVTIYANNLSFETINFDIPLTNEVFEYHHLNNNYLNGGLIHKGQGYKSEIYNGTNKYAGDYAHAEGYDENLNGFTFIINGEANSKSYNFTTTDENLYKLMNGLAIGLKLRIYDDNDYNLYNEATITDFYCNENEKTGIIYVDQTLNSENSIVDHYAYTNDFYGTVAAGTGSHAEGSRTFASGLYAHAEGESTIAMGSSSHAEGYQTRVSGSHAHAEGWFTFADGDEAHAEGSNTKASGGSSHAEGSHAEASGGRSHAEGWGAKASGTSSHAEGYQTKASGDYAHAEGNGYFTSRAPLSLTGDANATTYTTYYNMHSVVLNHPKFLLGATLYSDPSIYITSVGYTDFTINSITLSKTLDSENAISSKTYYFDYDIAAKGASSHVEGTANTAAGEGSHAEGYCNMGYANYSHVEGRNTIASGEYQHVQGKYNIEDSSGTYAHIVGNGTTSSRSNAHTLDWNGNGWYAGKVSAGTIASPASVTNTNDLTTKAYVDNAVMGFNTNIGLLAGTAISSPSNGQVLSYDSTNKKWVNADVSHPKSDWNETTTTNASYIDNKPAIKSGTGENSVIIGTIEDDSSVATYTLYLTGVANSRTYSYTTQDTLPSSIRIGSYVEYSNQYSTYASSIESIDTTNHSITLKSTFYDALSNAEVKVYYRYANTAKGKYSLAEGRWTRAMENFSHAEGSSTLAGYGAHSEGSSTSAKGMYSHSEGWYTSSIGQSSHSEGYGTIASSEYQHVQGKYNIEDTSDAYAHIVGNGTDSNTRSNAHTLDWSGNSWYAGKVSAGTVASPASVTNANDLTTKAYVDNALSGVTTNLAGLTDTTVSSPSNGQILIYNSTTSKWENTTSPYQTQAQVNALIAAALAEYGDGDTATYGYTDGNEVNY